MLLATTADKLYSGLSAGKMHCYLDNDLLINQVYASSKG